MDRILERQALAALDFTTVHGGGTFEGRTMLPFTPRDGYAVAIGGMTFKATDVTPDVLAWACRAVTGEWDTAFAGTWVDDGVFYIDAVQYVSNRDRAMALGREHAQKAIYDFEAQEVITL